MKDPVKDIELTAKQLEKSVSRYIAQRRALARAKRRFFIIIFSCTLVTFMTLVLFLSR